MGAVAIATAAGAFCISGCRKTDGKTDGKDTTAVKPTVSVFAKGADISWVTEMEAAGRRFYNASGTQTECFALMKGLGMNSIRLRVFVNPSDGWCNQADVVAKAKRAAALGLRVMIDFHYSDVWADPGHQTKPSAWTDFSVADLKTALSAHTKDVLNALKSAGVTPEWVQVGNETSDGFLWETCRASKNMANYAALTEAGYEAVKSVFPDAKVIVHIDNGWDKVHPFHLDLRRPEGQRLQVGRHRDVALSDRCEFQHLRRQLHQEHPDALRHVQDSGDDSRSRLRCRRPDKRKDFPDGFDDKIQGSRHRPMPRSLLLGAGMRF